MSNSLVVPLTSVINEVWTSTHIVANGLMAVYPLYLWYLAQPWFTVPLLGRQAKNAKFTMNRTPVGGYKFDQSRHFELETNARVYSRNDTCPSVQCTHYTWLTKKGGMRPTENPRNSCRPTSIPGCGDRRLLVRHFASLCFLYTIYLFIYLYTITERVVGPAAGEGEV